MTVSTATLVYTATTAPTVSDAQLMVAMAAVFLDTTTPQLLGCTLFSDVTSIPIAGQVQRQLVFALSDTPSTTIAAPSNGQVLPQPTINVASTAGFPSAGTLFIDTDQLTSQGLIPLRVQVTYTGITPTSFTGCSGGEGTLHTLFPLSSTATTTTTIAPASNGAVLPQAIINVASTANFPEAGVLSVTSSAGVQTIKYTNITPTSFTGCTGGHGTLATGGLVANAVFPYTKNFPNGTDQSAPFRNLYTHALSGGLGTMINETEPVIS